MVVVTSGSQAAETGDTKDHIAWPGAWELIRVVCFRLASCIVFGLVVAFFGFFNGNDFTCCRVADLDVLLGSCFFTNGN